MEVRDSRFSPRNLNEIMEKRIITLKDITPAFGMADYVVFTLKEDFNNRNNIRDYDPIVIYVKRMGDKPDYWFDRAHLAEALDWADNHPGELLPGDLTTHHPMPERVINEQMPVSDDAF